MYGFGIWASFGIKEGFLDKDYIASFDIPRSDHALVFAFDVLDDIRVIGWV